MVFKSKISPDKRALAILLRKESGLSFPKIAEKCKISTSSAERICKGGFCQSREKQITSKKTGRPRKISPRVARMLQRNLLKMRNEGLAVTVKKLVEYSGLSLQTASVGTYSRYLNDMGFFFLQARKKGLLTENNKKLRLQFARKMERYEKENAHFWANEIAFYLDGVSFIHKCNPKSAAMAPKARVWRRKSEGLQVTSKGSKDLAGGKRLHLMVAVAYHQGVILKEPYEKLNGNFFANFIRRHFNLCFARAGPKKDGKRIFVQDNDPSMVSKAAMTALHEIECELFKLPSCSADINPIEGIFHILKDLLEEQAIENNITKESFEEFQKRVLRTLEQLDPDIIDKAIDSMPRRMKAIIKGKGSRTKY